ncbi:methionyl-tRNA formyltransferase [Muriicola jejuensis]|uniref:Methionyl-tRNA formyltransferase n=1 Tax=Muriicola jejuensis TaxID=504488 RepID=A0A6P0UFT9_9FLAO|nr:methionyl-tRNA formyltransferase [Muriicola jejuensis]NER11492.1 methionyl-tRNA formyltransferase [Muriicola jejuensis]SMP20326.1 methionyl-tRNA formyltransferase [Muriicola jejuensis]
MRDLRIVFMGTPDFAVATLEALVNSPYTVVGVITAPDRPAGRGQSLRESAVKQYALKKGLKVLQPTNLKKEDFLTELRSLEANLQIVVAFRMLPRAVWNMPEYGTFNLHASLLPDYRGAAPINWAIINGETKTGVTTFFIDEKIDTGAIILQEECRITEEDTAGDLHDRLMNLGADLVLKTVGLIAKDEVKTFVQKELKTVKDAPKLTRENCEINWKLPGREIYNLIRGLSPYPTAWTTLHNGSDSIYLKVYGASYLEEKHSEIPGQIMPHQKIRVAVEGGWIDLEEIQLPGKRKMGSREVLNGLKLDSKAYMR